MLIAGALAEISMNMVTATYFMVTPFALSAINNLAEPITL